MGVSISDNVMSCSIYFLYETAEYFQLNIDLSKKNFENSWKYAIEETIN